MKINPEIRKKLPDDHEEYYLLYLLCRQFNVEVPSLITVEHIEQYLLINNIINSDKELVVPIIVVEDVTNWVKEEYMALYKSIRPDLAKNGREAAVRMQKYLEEYPDVTKEEVLAATRKALTENDYPRLPHYFVFKGSGSEKTYDLHSYVEMIREEGENNYVLK